MKKKTFTKHRPVPYLYTKDSQLDSSTVCQALINGVSVSLIDPQIYNNVINSIYQYINDLSLEEDDDEYQILMKCIEDMKSIQKNSENNDEISFTSPRNKKRKIKEDPEKERMKILMNEVINSKTFPQMSDDEREKLIEFMQKEKRKMNEEENFREAISIQQGILRIQKEEQLTKLTELEEVQMDLLTTKKQNALNNYQDIKTRWENVLNQFKIYREDETKKLIDTQKEQLKEAEDKLKNEPPSSFRKESTYLQSLKQKKNALIQVRDYKEAEKIKYEIKIREKIEQQKIHEEWIEYCTNQLQQLRIKQERDLEVHIMAFDRQEEKLKLTMKEEIQAAYNKVRYFNGQISITGELQQNIENEKQIDYNPTKRNPRASFAKTSSPPQINLIRNRKKIANALYSVHPPIRSYK